MDTVLTRDHLVAAEFIRGGGVVAFPTETVYGLGADLFNEEAIRKIFAAKQRPQDNPLIAHIGDLSLLDRVASEVPPFAARLIARFFPGPLTLVLRKRDEIPLIATAGLDTIGVRMPGSELARQFLAACETPVVAPSANLSGRPSPTTWQAVFEDLNGRIDCILQGDPTEIGLESTVVDCTGDRPIVLRQGGVSLDELRSVVPDATADESEERSNRSPGLRHKHYSPKARVLIVGTPADLTGDFEQSAFIGLTDPGVGFAEKRIVPDLRHYAHELFEFFRECDRREIATIYCEAVSEDGIGAALMDRIRRAAQD